MLHLDSLIDERNISFQKFNSLIVSNMIFEVAV